MNLQSCLIIRCIALNTINMDILLLKLKKHILTYFPQAIISLEFNEPYWKYPECNEITYQLSNDQLITVSEFIENLPLSWNYKKFDNDEEDATWNQNSYPKECFLTPEIEWLHIYTWRENNN